MRKSYALLLPLMLLAACNPPAAEQQTADATPPETPVTAEPAAPAPAPSTPRAPAPPPYTPPAPGEPGGLPDDRTPLPEGPILAGSAQDAANVVQTYYALLEQGKYTQAWALWDNGGRASGLSAQAFAASFRPYSEYHANIGGPGRVDAGAGQRHVDVPVQVYGRLRDSRQPFNQRGTVTLHRTADIPGATAEQRSWRISASTVNPRPVEPIPQMPPRPDRPDRPRPGQPQVPAPPSPTPPNVTATYRCEGDIRLVIDFDNGAGTATVRGGGRRDRAVLRIQPTGSGIHYAGGGYDLRGKGDDATWIQPGAQPIICKTGR